MTQSNHAQELTTSALEAFLEDLHAEVLDMGIDYGIGKLIGYLQEHSRTANVSPETAVALKVFINATPSIDTGAALCILAAAAAIAFEQRDEQMPLALLDIILQTQPPTPAP